ncbi:unnamed protein product, partial [Tetraodon nigroviridis]
INIVKWSSQGMLRLTQEAMNELFQPTVNNIIKHIGRKNGAGWMGGGTQKASSWMRKRRFRLCRSPPDRGADGEARGARRAFPLPGWRLCGVAHAAEGGAEGPREVLPHHHPPRRRLDHPQGRRPVRPGSHRGESSGVPPGMPASDRRLLPGQGAAVPSDLRRGRPQPLRGRPPPSREAPHQGRPRVVHRRPGPLRLRGPVGGPGGGGEEELHARSPGPEEDHRQHLLQPDGRRHLHLRPRREEVRHDNPGPARASAAPRGGGRSRGRRSGQKGDQGHHAVRRHGDQSHRRGRPVQQIRPLLHRLSVKLRRSRKREQGLEKKKTFGRGIFVFLNMVLWEG